MNNLTTTIHRFIADDLNLQRYASYPEVLNAETLLIRRPLLEESIYACLEKRLLLMVAPPGFGKTTALLQTLRTTEHHVIWHTIREGEIDAKKAADDILNTLSENTGQNLSPIGNTSPVGYAATIVRTLSRHTNGKVILVFDSLDRSERPDAIIEFIQCLLDNCPPRIHFIVASTSRPRLKVSRFARMGELTKITRNDLIFTIEDVKALLSLRWDEESADRFGREVFRMSGGSVANVNLILMAWRKPPSSGSISITGTRNPVPLFEPGKILSRLSNDEKQILLTVSLLPKFDIPFVRELCGNTTPKEQITSFLGSVPITRIAPNGWLSLAPALADELRTFAEIDWGIERINEIRRKSAWIFERRGEYDQAIELLLDTGSTEEASRVMDEIGIKSISERDSAIIVSWCERIDTNLNMGTAAHFVYATGQRLKGNFTIAIEHYNKILSNKISKMDILSFICLLHRLQVNFSDPDAEKARNILFSMTDDSPDTESQIRMLRGRVLSSEGKLNDAYNEFHSCLRIRQKNDILSDDYSTLYWMGFIDLKRGNYKSAHLLLQEYYKHGRGKEALAKILCIQVMGCLHLLNGESEAAHERFMDALEIARGSKIKLAEFHLILNIASIVLDEGNLEEASELIETAEYLLVQLDTGPYTASILAFHKACLFWELGDVQESVRYIQEYLNTPLNEPYFEGWWRLSCALFLYRAGLRDNVFTIAKEVYENAREMGARHLLSNAALILSYFSSLMGQIDDTESYGEECIRLVSKGRYRCMPSSDPELISWANEELTKRSVSWRPIEGPQRKSISSTINIGSSPITIKSLGTFEISYDGKMVDSAIWRSRTKSRLLFQILLSHASKTCSKDEIIDYLWPHADTQKGKRGLHTTVWALRKILKDAGLSDSIEIGYEFGFYRLVTNNNVLFDHDTFSSLITRGQTFINKQDPAKARDLLREAEDLYKGEFLPDSLYERFTDTTRTRLFELQSLCLKLLAESSENDDEALNWWRKALKHDPYSEEAYRGHIRTCIDTDHLCEAVESMEGLKKRIVSELDLPLPDWVDDFERELVFE